MITLMNNIKTLKNDKIYWLVSSKIKSVTETYIYDNGDKTYRTMYSNMKLGPEVPRNQIFSTRKKADKYIHDYRRAFILSGYALIGYSKKTQKYLMMKFPHLFL